MGIAGGRMVEIWQEWPRRDSNPHARKGPSVLSRRRLPIPPQGLSIMRFILFSPLIFELQRLTNFTKPRNGRAFDSRARETYNTGAKLMNGTYKTYVVGLIGRPINPTSPVSSIQPHSASFRRI